MQNLINGIPAECFSTTFCSENWEKSFFTLKIIYIHFARLSNWGKYPVSRRGWHDVMTSVEQQNLCRVSCTGARLAEEQRLTWPWSTEVSSTLPSATTTLDTAQWMQRLCVDRDSHLQEWYMVNEMIKYFYNDTIHWRFERVCVNGKMNAINKVHSWWFEETLSIRD